MNIVSVPDLFKESMMAKKAAPQTEGDWRLV